MSHVMVINYAIFDVTEDYADVAAAMDGPDLVELHVGDEPVTFRTANIIAVAATREALMQPGPTAPPGPMSIIPPPPPFPEPEPPTT